MGADEKLIALRVPSEGSIEMAVGPGTGPEGIGWYAQVTVGRETLTGGPFADETTALKECEILATKVADALRAQGCDVADTFEGWTEPMKRETSC